MRNLVQFPSFAWNIKSAGKFVLLLSELDVLSKLGSTFDVNLKVSKS